MNEETTFIQDILMLILQHKDLSYSIGGILLMLLSLWASCGLVALVTTASWMAPPIIATGVVFGIIGIAGFIYGMS